MRVTYQRLEPARFRLQNGAPERQQPVVPSSIVFAAGINDEVEGHQPGDRRVKRASAEAHVATRTLGDILNHTVTMALAVGQGEQDVELMSRQRQKAKRVRSHTSNLDVLGLDVWGRSRVGCAPVGNHQGDEIWKGEVAGA
jgi:hypothetical protein